MDIKNIKSLIRMVTQTDITEFELESGGEKLVIRRGSEVVTTSMPVTPMQVAAPAAAAAPVAAPEAPVESAAADDGLEEVTSPIVGTFYRSPSPESDAYVEVGSVVEKGQTLCIVEAMKLMNEIEAEFKCKVVKVLKENAEPVEYGDPLFLVEPL
jgi:acetyl-CoA carboxylase biotin carboxyl carrier protein